MWMMAATNEKVNECIEKALNSLSVVGRPNVLKHEQKISVGIALLAIAEKYKTNMKLTFFAILHVNPFKSLKLTRILIGSLKQTH